MHNYDARKRILVTGDARFIGSHLVDRLIARHEVGLADNLFTGAKRSIETRGARSGGLQKRRSM